MPPQTAPYDFSGNLMHFPSLVWDQDKQKYVDPMWVDNKPFMASLYLGGFQRGRSAAYYMWENINGAKFPMFLSDMLDVVQNCTIKNGVVNSLWHCVKKGQNYGIQLFDNGNGIVIE